MNRDVRFDCIKGIATVLVLVGHVMQFSIPDFSTSIFFNIIWTLQIPLFMVLSGYFGVYKGSQSFRTRLMKKICVYLIPFASYFVINIFLNFNCDYGKILALPYHLDLSLWYLFALFVLTVISDISTIIARRLKRCHILSYTCSFFFFVGLYFCLCFLGGMGFLGVKLVAYYSVFYWVGWFWRQIVLENVTIPIGLVNHFGKIAYVVAFFLYFSLIVKFDFYSQEDTIVNILIRVMCSFSGVFLVIKSTFAIHSVGNRIWNALEKCGQKSLKIYYLHCLFVIRLDSLDVMLMSVEGVLIVSLISFALLTLCYLMIKLVEVSPLLNAIVFGEIPLKKK